MLSLLENETLGFRKEDWIKKRKTKEIMRGSGYHICPELLFFTPSYLILGHKLEY